MKRHKSCVDTKVVSFITTVHPSHDESSVKRKRKHDGTEIVLTSPSCVHDYNKNVGPVDGSNQMRQAYGIDRKSKRWWIRLFLFMLDVTTVNSFIIYKRWFERLHPPHPASGTVGVRDMSLSTGAAWSHAQWTLRLLQSWCRNHHLDVSPAMYACAETDVMTSITRDLLQCRVSQHFIFCMQKSTVNCECVCQCNKKKTHILVCSAFSVTLTW